MNELLHLLNRTSFGPNAASLAEAERLGYEGFVDAQLDPDALNDNFVDDFLNDLFPSLTMNLEELRERNRLADESDDPSIVAPAIEIIAATLLRQLFSTRQLHEVVTEFWSNHFNVFIFDGPVEWMKTVEDRDVIRPLGLGRFRDLVRADAASPAMVFYLDNYANTVEGPQENYARELMELHTMGVDGGYTEADVREVARCFTGWTITEEVEGYFTFYRPFHDTDEKTVLGTTIPAGGGIEDGEKVIELLSDHPATARFIATKLIRRFVEDQPSEALVDSIADRFTVTGGDIRETLRTLLLSSEFRAAQGVKFKRPGEFLISSLRALEPNLTDSFLLILIQQLLRLGQLPFYWSPPTGYPDTAAYWISSANLMARTNLAFSIGQGDVPFAFRDDEKRAPAPVQSKLAKALTKGERPAERGPVMADVLQIPILDMLGDARTPTAIADVMINRVLGQTVDATDRQLMIDYVASGLDQDTALPLARATEQGRGLIALLLGSRYFQYR